MIKIDAEGHDLAVLRGGQQLLKTHAISVLQFEYNHRWIYSRTYLRMRLNCLENSDTP
jgi:hypothetical protein